MFSKIISKISIIVTSCIILVGCDGIGTESFSQDDIIALEVFDFDETQNIEEAVGDGTTKIKLKAQIPSNSKYTTISFESTNGTFIKSGKNTHEQNVDIDGAALVDLKLPLDNQPIFFTASIKNDKETFSSTKSINLIGVDKVISLSLLDTNGKELTGPIRADGATIVKLKATVKHNQNTFNQISFTTSKGALQGTSPVKIDEENNAFIDVLVPNTIQKLYFSAKVGTNSAYFDNKELNLERSNPDSIIIEPSAVSMTLNSSNPIDIFLKKNEGLVSLNSTVSIRSYQIADDNTQKEVGRFTGLANTNSDTNGLIKVTFKTDTGDIDTAKPIHVEVNSINDSSETVSETVTITII